ncbi:MAG: hypothetical protein ACOCUR_02295 [Nanoarchaeota archaeon]
MVKGEKKMSNYVHTSSHKEKIRAEWVNSIKQFFPDKDDLTLVDLPSEEIEDLKLFSDEGLIKLEQEGDAEVFNVSKGKIFCFEMSGSKCAQLTSKLCNAVVLPEEIGKYIQNNQFSLLENGSVGFSMFPLDICNLDFDKNISKNGIPINVTLENIVKIQKNFQKDFLLFLTFPQCENEDKRDFKLMLKSGIKANLEKSGNERFIEMFSDKYSRIENMNYQSLVVVGICKQLAKISYENNFNIEHNQPFTYGENGRKKMVSLIVKFTYSDNPDYLENALSSLNEVNELHDNGAVD